jgi:limonene-1,2-epoxide hydrolase
VPTDVLGRLVSLRFVSDDIRGVYEAAPSSRSLWQNAHYPYTNGVSLNQNEQLIETFYKAFQQRDAAAMTACYDPSIHFSDPVFASLHGLDADAMWAMLCEQGTDLKVMYSDISADDQTGSAHWEATYTFGPTSRRIHNKIDAMFEFQDGKIVRHVDNFDLWKWSRMALGFSGTVGGWLGPVQTKIRETANRALTKYIEGHPEYQEEPG